MNPGTSCRNTSGMLNASHSEMKRAALSAESTKIAPLRTLGWLATMPTTRPSRRASPTTISCAHRRLDLEERAGVDEPVDHVADVVGGVGVGGHDRRRAPAPAGRRRGARARAEVVGQVGQQEPGRGDRLPVVVEHLVAAAGDGGVHQRAAHLLQRGALAGDLLGDPRAGQVHRGVALDHRRPSRRTRACTRRPRPTGRAGSRSAAPAPTAAPAGGRSRDAPRRPGKKPIWSVSRPPAESTR